MIPTACLEATIEEKEEELQRLQFHVRYPETNVAGDRKEVFDNINRRIVLLANELAELEEVLDCIIEVNKNEQSNN